MILDNLYEVLEPDGASPPTALSVIPVSSSFPQALTTLTV